MYKMRLDRKKIINSKNKCFNIDFENEEFNSFKKCDYEIIENYNEKIIKFIKNKLFYILGFIVFLIIMYLNSIRIDNIKFIGDKNELILFELNKYKKTFLGFTIISNIDEVKNELIKKYNFEYFDINHIGNDLVLTIIGFKEYKDNNQIGNGIAKKSGFVTDLIIKNGKAEINNNTYVKKGDVLITSKDSKPLGNAYAEVVYLKEICVERKKYIYEYYGYEEKYGFSFLNKSFMYIKNKINCDIIEMKNINLGIIKIKKYKIKKRKMKEINLTYNMAYDYSLKKINEMIEIGQIMDIKKIDFYEKNDSYIFNYYVKIKEDILEIRS